MTELFEQGSERVDKEHDPSTKTERADIVLLSPRGCSGAELGVDTGHLSRRFLELGHLSCLHSVDKWCDHAHPRSQYLAVARRLLPYKESKVWRMTAQEFAQIIPDESLGFIYIDCYAHTGQDGGEVLRVMWPKLQSGGLFSGDDYDDRKWPKTYFAVDQFAKNVNRSVQVREGFTITSQNSMDNNPTWYFFK